MCLLLHFNRQHFCFFSPKIEPWKDVHIGSTSERIDGTFSSSAYSTTNCQQVQLLQTHNSLILKQRHREPAGRTVKSVIQLLSLFACFSLFFTFQVLNCESSLGRRQSHSTTMKVCEQQPSHPVTLLIHCTQYQSTLKLNSEKTIRTLITLGTSCLACFVLFINLFSQMTDLHPTAKCYGIIYYCITILWLWYLIYI